MESVNKPRRTRRPASEETRMKMSVARKGVPKSEAQKQKMRDYWANVRSALAVQEAAA
jgi:hypothetical protein